MVRKLTDADLCKRAVEALQESLAPVDALRFLSLVRTTPRNYIRWRDEYFRNVSTDEILNELERMDRVEPKDGPPPPTT